MPIPLPFFAAAALAPLAATAALTLGLAAALAARPSPPPDGGRRRLPYAMDDAAQLRGELALDVVQETIWNKAESSCWDGIGKERRRRLEHYAALLAIVSDAQAEPQALVAAFGEHAAQRDELADYRIRQWATVYQALDAQQQEKARRFIKRRLEQALADAQPPTRALRH